ncbi:MAG: M48 family metallopeptidase [Saprospiraceae bacterium]
MISKKLFFGLMMLLPFFYSGCKAGSGLGGLNFFSVQDDIALGAQVNQQIESDPKQFPVLREQGNEKLYSYVRGISTKILNSGQVKHKDDFVWQIKIIDDPETLNAFCTPGGYIYVYTGLIKFLDSEDQLAGVMGHEIAHADLRHSTRQMTKIYGLQTLLQIATGKSDPGMIEQIALGLVNLKFSRGHETESDNNSVKYLCATNYNAAGAAGFFKKMEGNDSPPEFMSTHPNPGNRVQNIESKSTEMSCKGNNKNTSVYNQMKKLIK